ncbi:hypothetical protein F5887DRAFT_1250067, partial [Amanita rubescens]
MARTSKAKRIAQFFARYPKFDYDSVAPVNSEFQRLVRCYKWKRGSAQDKKAWAGFSTAMGKQFADYYGTDVYDINAWQALCMALGVHPVPDTISECKEIIKSTHVNLVDFIDVQVTGRPVQIFETEEELREYTKNTRKIYPLDAAKRVPATHIADFFANYADFVYNPGAPVSSQFRRLVKGWDRESLEYEEAWSGFGAAMGRQFVTYYGSDVHDINAWQALCIALRVDPLPDSILGCKRIIRSKHVNLVDFIDVQTTGKPVRIFDTVQMLRRYTKRTKKIYPKQACKGEWFHKPLSSVVVLGPSLSKVVEAKTDGAGPRSEATHIADFFANYPDFSHNPGTPVSVEFQRLAKRYKWKRKSPEYKDAWAQFGAAMGKQFADYYGSDVHDINAWQALCIELGVDPVPDTIAQCKKIMKSTHVNLVDFIDIRSTPGGQIRKFNTREELKRYTNKRKKYYPLDAAKESGVLASLLRQI